MFRRFSTFDIILHFTMMVTFIGLVLTGIPLKFSHAPWAGGLMRFMGGAFLAGLIHRICAAITFVYFGVTLGYIVYFLFTRKYRETQIPCTGFLVQTHSALVGRIFKTSSARSAGSLTKGRNLSMIDGLIGRNSTSLLFSGGCLPLDFQD